MATRHGRQILARASYGERRVHRVARLRIESVSCAQNLPNLPRAKDALSAAQNGFKFYKNLQSDDGHWAGEYGGPMFLLPGFVIGSYVTGMTFTREERLEMIRYLLNRADPNDGGWGMCVELLWGAV